MQSSLKDRIFVLASLVDKLGNEGSDAIENQAKKVETLSNQADLAEDNASKLVDKIGKSIIIFTVFIRLIAAVFIKLLAFPKRRLFKGGVYRRATFISKSHFVNH